jgi:hypothetical protein
VECSAGTGIATLVRVEGQRWAIEDSFETAKNELGLDHNESRSRHGWHRHVSLGHAGLRQGGDRPAGRQHGHRSAPKKTATDVQTQTEVICWSVQDTRSIATRLALKRIQPAHIIAWSCWRRAR